MAFVLRIQTPRTGKAYRQHVINRDLLTGDIMTPETPALKGSERKYLRSLAHRLKPVVHIGKTGLSPSVMTAIDDALDHHELIKIRFQNFKDQKKELSQTVVQESNCALIGSVGHIYIFYRQHPDPEKRKIKLAGG